MTAVVLPFKGKWHGRPNPASRKGMAEARAVYDARLIKAAKHTNDDWTARLLLALLDTLDRKQLERLEFRLLGMDLNSESALQALAIVELQNGTLAHRNRVKEALGAFEPREVPED